MNGFWFKVNSVVGIIATLRNKYTTITVYRNGLKPVETKTHLTY